MKKVIKNEESQNQKMEEMLNDLKDNIKVVQEQV